MITKEQTLKAMGYESEILDIIANAEEFTTSDLQGVVGALVLKIMNHE